jgi:ribonuclease R
MKKSFKAFAPKPRLPKKKDDAPFLCIFTKGELTPIDKKGDVQSFPIKPEHCFNAQEGDLVKVEFTRNIVRVTEIVGKGVSEKAVSLIALLARDIPYIFPPEAIQEALRAKPLPLGTRDDLRHLPFFTIDPIDAKDHDDAVFAQKTEEGFTLYVAIADVAAYVTPHSAIDDEALKRGNSVYFPDRVVPMLPEELSTDLCSLKEKQDRPALVCCIEINEKGKKL